MPRSRRRQQDSRQGNPQSYGSRSGGFEQTGMGYRYEDQQGRFGNPQSRQQSGSGRWDQRGNWSGDEGWREPSERSEYSEGRDYGSDYDRESRFGRGGYEGTRGMGQQDWSQGRSSSYGGATRVGWGPAGEDDRSSWAERDEYRYGRGSEEAGFDDEEYRGMGSGYPRAESYRFNEGDRGEGWRGSMGGGFRGAYEGGRSSRQGSEGWGRGASQGSYGLTGQRGMSGMGPSGRTSQTSFAGRGPQGYKRSDERITEDVNEALTQDHDLDASNITVEVQNGEITLKGTVTDREAKRRAEDIAESCSGVREVQNQLRIKRESDSDSESRTTKSEKGEEKRSQRQQIAS